jgi:phosphopantetheinyl transferase (holo-ACP synthase)
LIGNDIVDLNRAAKESNWKRKGYLEKIFTAHERFLIHSAKDPEIMVWLLWTMKESVYKVCSKESKIRSFNPGSLCSNNLIIHDSTAMGNVTHEDTSYYCRSTVTPAYIHTIASAEMERLDHAILKITGYDASDSSYRNTNPASVSHHGRYLALIYL